MERYKDRTGASGINAYQIGINYIDVKFTGSARIYRYSYNGGAGQKHVEAMKNLAVNGSGLNGYVNRNVKSKYDK